VTNVTLIWNHKNKVVFRGGIIDEEEIFTLTQLKSWLWLKYRTPRILFS